MSGEFASLQSPALGSFPVPWKAPLQTAGTTPQGDTTRAKPDVFHSRGSKGPVCEIADFFLLVLTTNILVWFYIRDVA